MGAGTDKKIGESTAALQTLQVAYDDFETATEDVTTAWGGMMAAYDKDGKRHPNFKAPLEAAISALDKAKAALRKAYNDAVAKLSSFEKYVDAKDKGTINPFAKKSVGKAKKFIKVCKAEVAFYSDIGTTPTADLMKYAKEHYV